MQDNYDIFLHLADKNFTLGHIFHDKATHFEPTRGTYDFKVISSQRETLYPKSKV